MKKIVILATYVGIVNRGAETFVIELVKKLEQYYDIEVYSLGVDESIKEKIIKVDVNFPFWYKFHTSIYNKFHLYKVLCDRAYFAIPTIIDQHIFTTLVYKKYLKDRKDIDLLFPNNGSNGAKMARLIKNKYNIPFIYTGHGGIGDGERRILNQKPDIYIALNETHKRWAISQYHNIIKIHNGVDVNSFKPKFIEKDKKSKTVLCVGAFIELKRQKLLIDAVSILNNVNLILLGSGKLYDELKAYGHAKLGSRFEIKSVAYNDIYKYYEKSDLFSLPTKEEPFGIVYLEAMSMNLPIVAPDDESRREIISEAGLFCDVENPEKYAESILKALNMDWKSIPRDRAINNFDWSMIAKTYRNEIDKLLAFNKL